jgi:hypothetical protein
VLQIVDEIESVISDVAQRKREDHGGQQQSDGEIEIEQLETPLSGELEKARPGSQAQQAQDHQEQDRGITLWQDHESVPEV